MILESFIAKNVYGYLNFNIIFNKDLNFLVGGNGSGKTTVLKLINALLVPNFHELLVIPFTECAVTLSENKKKITIIAQSDGSEITLRVSGVNDVLTLPCLSDAELEFLSDAEDRKNGFIEKLNIENSDSEIIAAISKIPSPIYLGLDRRKDTENWKDINYFSKRDVALSKGWSKNSIANARRRRIRGSLGVSLMETEMLVQGVYKRLRDLEEYQSVRLRDKILLSAFEYTEFDFDERSIEKLTEPYAFLERKKEIMDVLSKIGIEDQKINAVVDNFFSKISALFKKSDKKDSFHIEMLTNKAQIDRISSIVEVIDEYKSKLDKLFGPINQFLSVVNDFYKDSGKVLKVDTVGRLVVERPNKKECSIEGLSSGERQLLVIFAHAFFNRFETAKKAIFMIDEPELSLHLGWQEKFAETIYQVTPKAQFLMATHSPEIIGDNKNKSIACR